MAFDLRHFAIHHYLQRNLDQAVFYLKKGARICQKIGPKQENLHKRILFNLGSFQRLNGDYYEAIKAYRQLIGIGGEDDLTAEAYTEIGRNYMELGDFYNALSYHNQAMSLLRQRGMFNALLVDRINAANAYIQLNQRELTIEGITSLQKAALQYDSVRLTRNDHATYNSRDYQVNITLGKLLHGETDLGHLGDALGYYRKALATLEASLDSGKMANALNNIGVLFLDQGEIDSAKHFFSKAILFSTANQSLSSLIYRHLSSIALREDLLNDALELSDKAVYLAAGSEQYFPIEKTVLAKYETSMNKARLLNAIVVRADIWRAFDVRDQNPAHLKKAYHLYSLADGLLDSIRLQSFAQQSRLFWQKEASSFYLNAVSTCYKLGKIDRAFYFMEKNKATLLLEALEYERRKSGTTLPANLKTREFNLKRAITGLEEQLAYGETQDADSIRDMLIKQKLRHSAFIDSLRSEFPDYYLSKVPPLIISLQEARKQDPFLQYIFAAPESNMNGYLLFADEKTEFLFEISDLTNLHKQIDLYRSLIAKPFRTTSG